MKVLKNISIVLFSIIILNHLQAVEPKTKPNVQVEREKNKTVQMKVFTESVLIRALEKGNSLVVAKILSVRANPQKIPGRLYFYKAKIIRPIILGDLTEDDIEGPVELFAGSSFGNALAPGSIYALFITKQCPYHFDWAFRDDVVKLDSLNDEKLQSMLKAATKAYKKTAIRQFRESKLKGTQSLPKLPGEILAACEQFRANPQNRAAFAKKIHESDMGSRQDLSQQWSSQIKYLPPNIILSREQVLSILGKPTLKCGWTYKWFCGKDNSISSQEKGVGVLSITFDEYEKAACVLYSIRQGIRWEKAGGKAELGHLKASLKGGDEEIADFQYNRLSILTPTGWWLHINPDGSGDCGFGSFISSFFFPSGTFRFDEIRKELSSKIFKGGNISEHYAISFVKKGSKSNVAVYTEDEALVRKIFELAHKNRMGF
ncbi:MAG: hypothetical protein ACYSSI_08585, partial [Planctomycetota bacterium]